MSFQILHPAYNVFPHPETADPEGLLAIGGDLDPQRLITAYSFGIFPWYNEGDPIIWWSPDPRSVIKPGEVRVTKSMRPFLKRYELRIDETFEEVIDHCRIVPRRGEQGSWITDEMTEAYIELHRMGLAHSFETWHEGKLVGGLYGVSLGRCFFGESMFSLDNNASKFAFIRLNQVLKINEFLLIDCQVPNDHLTSMGCYPMPRKEYLKIMRKNLGIPSFIGKWDEILATDKEI